MFLQSSRSKSTLWLKNIICKRYLAICEKWLRFSNLQCSASPEPGFLRDHPSLLKYCPGRMGEMPGLHFKKLIFFSLHENPVAVALLASFGQVSSAGEGAAQRRATLWGVGMTYVCCRSTRLKRGAELCSWQCVRQGRGAVGALLGVTVFRKGRGGRQRVCRQE